MKSVVPRIKVEAFNFPHHPRNNAMKSFVQRHASIVTGVLSGFDRLVLHGVPRLFAYTSGLLKYLCHRRIRLKDFGTHSRQLSDRIIAASLKPVEDAGRPVLYLPGSKDDKEALARQIAAKDRVKEGTICVLKTVELCRSYEVSANAQTRRIELRRRDRKCLHLYHYHIHPVFGFMHVRLQTWYPFDLQVCLNGREWLSRQLDKAGIGYVRQRNTFAQVDDLPAAQRMLRRQIRASWTSLLRGLVRSVHPLSREFFVTMPDGSRAPVGYYWTAPQSEWATDVMFTSRAELLALYDRLVRHGITSYGPGDVLRFFGRRVKADGTPWANFPEEIASDVKTRSEGTRIKHRAGGNSLKMYDKGSVLRVETTLYRPRDFRVFRKPEGKPDAAPRWMPLRQSLADLKRRAEVSQKANERLLEAQAAVDSPVPLKQIVATLCRPAQLPGRLRADGTRSRPRRFRALNPLAEQDGMLLAVISRPEFAQNGLRNRDLRSLLCPRPSSHPVEQKRQSAAISRKLALLRAHGLLRKVPHTHRYTLTDFGHQIITTILAAQNASSLELAQLAA
jgi:hypothetical protein